MCREWCNPAPTDGSAPNLVIPTTDKDGKPCLKRAFNTQACEQLNSWLGGYESILKLQLVFACYALLPYKACFEKAEITKEKRRREE